MFPGKNTKQIKSYIGSCHECPKHCRYKGLGSYIIAGEEKMKLYSTYYFGNLHTEEIQKMPLLYICGYIRELLCRIIEETSQRALLIIVVRKLCFSVIYLPRYVIYYTYYTSFTILHYATLYYTILYYTILYYTTLHYTILYYTILYTILS